MARVQVRPFERGDLDAAAALLAETHRRDRERFPVLVEALADADEARTGLARWLDEERTAGAVALDGETLAGFLIGERSAGAPPDSYMAQLGHARSITIGARDHAIADGFDATAIYRVLYRELAAGWVAAGYFHHNVHVIAGDERLQQAWFHLGFGRHVSIAVREGTGPVAGADAAADVDIRMAGSEDMGVVLELARTLGVHHLDSPMFMFWPVLPEYDGMARNLFTPLLEDDTNPHFVAYHDGKPVGLTSFLREGFPPRYVNGERNVYLFMGIVDPEAQAGGIGRALLDRGMAWAREQGFERCSLHVLSANHSGEPFWFANGFEPVEWHLERHIDERVAWASGGGQAVRAQLP